MTNGSVRMQVVQAATKRLQNAIDRVFLDPAISQTDAYACLNEVLVDLAELTEYTQGCQRALVDAHQNQGKQRQARQAKAGKVYGTEG